MRIFKNSYEAASELQRDLWEMGVEVPLKRMQDKVIEGDDRFLTKEVYGYSFQVLDISDKNRMLEFYDRNKEWADADFEERIDPSGMVNPGEAYKLREEIWKEFIHGGEFSYTYNQRIGEEIEFIVKKLKDDPNTRQAILSVWDRLYDGMGMNEKLRVPCSIFYQFINRNGKLNIVYVMRSADLLEHFPYDYYMATKLLEHVAERTGNEVGTATFFITSLHCYKGQAEKRGIF